MRNSLLLNANSDVHVWSEPFSNSILCEARRDEPRHETYNNVVCATSKASDQHVHTQSDQSLYRSLELSMTVKLLAEHHLEFLSIKEGCRGSSESTLVKMPHCWKLHDAAQIHKRAKIHD